MGVYLRSWWARSFATAILVSLDSPWFGVEHKNSDKEKKWKEKQSNNRFIRWVNKFPPSTSVIDIVGQNVWCGMECRLIGMKSVACIQMGLRLSAILLPSCWFFQPYDSDFRAPSPYQWPYFVSFLRVK